VVVALRLLLGKDVFVSVTSLKLQQPEKPSRLSTFKRGINVNAAMWRAPAADRRGWAVFIGRPIRGGPTKVSPSELSINHIKGRWRERHLNFTDIQDHFAPRIKSS